MSTIVEQVDFPEPIRHPFCLDHIRWTSILVRDEASRIALDEILSRLEAAETDNDVNECIFVGQWPNSRQILQDALDKLGPEPSLDECS